MSLLNHTVGAAATVTRHSPHFRGLGRLYSLFNRMIISAGADPVVTANMRDGSRIVVDLRTNTDVHAYYRGEYDPTLLGAVRHLIDPSACLIDVGANIGFYSVAIGLHLRTMNAGGKVAAFEPLGTNYQRLLENLKLNDLTGHCVAYNLGLSNRSTDAIITLREDFGRGSNTATQRSRRTRISTADFRRRRSSWRVWMTYGRGQRAGLI